MHERILVVDDDPSVHEVMRAYLERDGYIVYSAMSGVEGLDLTQIKQPSLIILDRMLPTCRARTSAPTCAGARTSRS